MKINVEKSRSGTEIMLLEETIVNESPRFYRNPIQKSVQDINNDTATVISRILNELKSYLSKYSSTVRTMIDSETLVGTMFLADWGDWHYDDSSDCSTLTEDCRNHLKEVLDSIRDRYYKYRILWNDYLNDSQKGIIIYIEAPNCCISSTILDRPEMPSKPLQDYSVEMQKLRDNVVISTKVLNLSATSLKEAQNQARALLDSAKYRKRGNVEWRLKADSQPFFTKEAHLVSR